MQDVSVRVGGLTSIFGPYASAFNFEGEVDSSQAGLCMVENFSPWTFQIGNEAIPAMFRRTFALDNYPSLHWSINGGSVVQFGVGQPRLVRIILDPYKMTSDGPVYPTPIPIAGMLDASTPTDQAGGYVIDAKRLLGQNPQGANAPPIGTPTIPWHENVKDPAIVGLQLNVTSDLTPSIALVECIPVEVTTFVFYGTPQQTPLLYDPNRHLSGKEYSMYWDIPGASAVVISNGTPGATSGGAIFYTAWVGYHL